MLNLAARRLVESAVRDPEAPLLAAVTGCGGSGKSTVLDLLADVYGTAGVPVIRIDPGKPAAIAGQNTDSAILVDDAHQLDTAALDQLRAVAERGAARLIVAYRAWPRSRALSALVTVLSSTRAPIVLGRWHSSALAERLALLLDEPPEPRLVELVAHQTDGRPALVDLFAMALRDARRRGGDTAATTEVPPGVPERLRHDVEIQPEHVRALLLARAIGAPSDPEVLAALLDATPATVLDALDAAQATGLLTDDGELLPLTRQAVLRSTPTPRLQAARQRLAEIHSKRGGSVLQIAHALLDTGASGAQVATILATAGDEALRESPSLAARLYAEAVHAGAPAINLAARRAEALALTGDLDGALRLTDRVVGDRTAPDRVRAALVAAAVVAHRGLLARSAELYRWSGAAAGGASAGPITPLSVPALIGTGALTEAHKVLAPVDTTPTVGGPYPTLLAGAASLMAQGMYDSVAGSPTSALSALTRAAVLLEPAGPTVLLPDTPAALAALVGLHCGELDVASSALERAIATDMGGPPARTRHRLLQSWIAMMRGNFGKSAELLTAEAPPHRHLEPRDQLVAAALQVALARRHSDVAGLTRAWQRAREAIVRHPVDLYALQPLGELAVAAARLGEQRWLEPHVAEAQELLRRLGNPPLWAAPLHWFGFHAAITAEQPPEAARHAAALADTASRSAYASRLATAARTWLRVLAGEIDATLVEAAARGLHAVGMAWEGSRLAGQAAIRAESRGAMTALLGCARALQAPTGAAEAPVRTAPEQAAAQPESPPQPQSPGGAMAATGEVSLSDREREVAVLLLAGLTHKQIGERLFISPKTVEHHVSRMRQRLGSSTRVELFSHLRLLLGQR
jgi:DNA-binding CsgD family transcriptional regulator